MSAGSTSFGSELSAYYSSKTWNGTNGKYTVTAGKKFLNWNPYTMTAREAHQKPGSTGQYMGVVWGPHNVNWTANDTLTILGKLSDSIKGHSFNLGVALAESPQSLQLVVGTVTRIAKAITSLKRGRVDLAVRALGAAPRIHHNKTQLMGPRGRRIQDPRELTSKDVSAMWLEVQYGWKPLLQDVYEAHSAFVERTVRPRSWVYTTSLSRRWKPYHYEGNAYATWDTTASTSRQIKAVLTETLSVPRALGLTNPASVVWEKVPFSFVADWFIPIGTYLDALNTFPHITGKFLISDLTTSNTTGFGKKAPYNGARTTASVVILSRSVQTNLSIPRPEFKSISQSLSTGHLKNATALLHQLLK